MVALGRTQHLCLSLGVAAGKSIPRRYLAAQDSGSWPPQSDPKSSASGTEADARGAVYSFTLLSATGTSILLAAIVSGFILGFSPSGLVRAFWRTCVRVRYSLLTIVCMLAIGFVTRYSGTDATLGLAFARAGGLYPFFGTLLGWL